MKTDTHLELYRKLFLIRTAEEAIIEHYPEDEMKTPMHMSMGQEAIPVGVCTGLGDRGQIFTSYRTHAAFLAQTNDVMRFFAEMYGKVTGTAKGKSGSMHMALPERGFMYSSGIVAGSIPIAVGMAYANKCRMTNKVACVFFGDGATNEGSFWESLNIACLKRLPVLFVCEDNGFAVHTSTKDRQGYGSILSIVDRFNCGIFQGWGTDPAVYYTLTQEALKHIDRVGSPAFMYAECYRYLEHVGIYEDYDAGYRSRMEYDHHRSVDCIKVTRKHLLDRGVEESAILIVESACKARVKLAISEAKRANEPILAAIYEGVFYDVTTN